MIDVTVQPMPLAAANDYLRGLVNVPTVLSSAELAIAPDFDARVRAHSFFSATVDTANVLDDIRSELLEVAEGRTDQATARWRVKRALVKHGYAADDVGMTDTPPAGMDEDEWKRRKSITNLASTRRINLILTQNARMGWAIGRKQVSEHPAVMARWPNYRYIARDDGAARPDHAALNGMVRPKTDPFWHAHTPPRDFNCRCDIEDDDTEVVGNTVVTENPDGSQTAKIANPATGAAQDILPPESGFVFRADEPFKTFDLARVRNLNLRQRVRTQTETAVADLGADVEITNTEA